MNEYPFVEIIWNDHSSNSTWKTIAEIPEDSVPSVCVTRGWLVFEDEVVINVVNSYIIENNKSLDDTVVGGESVILKADIVSRKTGVLMF